MEEQIDVLMLFLYEWLEQVKVPTFNFFLWPSLINSSLKCFAQMIECLLGFQFLRLTNFIHRTSINKSGFSNGNEKPYFVGLTTIT